MFHFGAQRHLLVRYDMASTCIINTQTKGGADRWGVGRMPEDPGYLWLWPVVGHTGGAWQWLEVMSPWNRERVAGGQ